MTNHEIRIKIAESLGWKRKWQNRGGAPLLNEKPEGHSWVVWFDPNGHSLDKAYDPIFPPDYLNDLNAMHEAEEILKQKRVFTSYLSAIAKTCGFKAHGSEAWFYLHAGLEAVASATAAQRAEAFLRTLNLWEDSK